MSKTEDHNEDDVLAAEYAMHLLSAPERRAFEARLENEPQLRAALAAWQERLAPLADDVAEVAPPRRLKKSLEAQLFAPSQSQHTGLWGRLALWRGLSLASLVAVIVMAGWVYFQQTPQGGPVMVAEVAAADDSLRLLARYDEKSGVLEVSRLKGQAASGRALELWLIAGQDTAPVSLGVLPTDERGRILIRAQLQPLMTNAVLAISDEPLGGSPTGLPTGSVLAVGQINSV